MKRFKNYDFLTETMLFQGVSETDAEAMLHCLQAVCRSFRKNETVLHSGEKTGELGLVLSGSVNIENDDFLGNKSILENIGPGQAFAETYACIPEEPLMVNVTAAEDCEILFLAVERILTVCPSACSHHSRIIRNLLYVTAQKNLVLTRKIFHTAPKSLRGKLLSYLSFQAVKQGMNRFEIPFSRQQLADYLGVDRSALSNELSKMRNEGLLTFEKNRFCLKEKLMC